jgi:hypothetical protein
MLIVEQVLKVLKDNAPQTTSQLVARIPELVGQENGTEILRLLLRLDRRVESIDTDRWIMTAQAQDVEDQIVEAILAYFVSTGKRGEMIGVLVDNVRQASGHPPDRVHQIVLARFQHNAGKMVLNQMKEFE